jgi:hypothetical protein
MSGRSFGMHASITRASALGPEHAHITLESEDRPIDVGLAVTDRGVV